MSNVERMIKVLEDPEIDAGAKGAYVILAVVLEGHGEMSQIKSYCADHPRQLNWYMQRQLIRKGYVTREGGEYTIT